MFKPDVLGQSPTHRPLSAHHCVLVGQGPLPQRTIYFNQPLSAYVHNDEIGRKTSHSRRHISLPRVIWLYYNANSNSLGYLQCVYYKILYLTTIYIFLTHNQYTWILSLNIFPTLYGCFSDVQI